jgi:hypothetical protein
MRMAVDGFCITTNLPNLLLKLFDAYRTALYFKPSCRLWWAIAQPLRQILTAVIHTGVIPASISAFFRAILERSQWH